MTWWMNLNLISLKFNKILWGALNCIYSGFDFLKKKIDMLSSEQQVTKRDSSP